ncbi:GFA family protein [Vibrio astriarenae]|uniref:GFA family protein n=1 Tax=Vibrio astriarenae TaxID=1481923 RepID=UPI003736482B
MEREITGSCLCKSVEFVVKDDFKKFYFCHCEQCRKLTGSAHVSHLFTSPSNIRWSKGEELTQRYDHPTRTFSNVFCKECGSRLPYLSKNGRALVVPAGCLNEEPSRTPDAQIFCSEETGWHKAGLNSIKLNGFPENT